MREELDAGDKWGGCVGCWWDEQVLDSHAMREDDVFLDNSRLSVTRNKVRTSLCSVSSLETGILEEIKQPKQRREHHRARALGTKLCSGLRGSWK